MVRVIEKRLLNPEEAAIYLGISKRQLQVLYLKGKIIQTRLQDTRKQLYDVLVLDQFIEKAEFKNGGENGERN